MTAVQACPPSLFLVLSQCVLFLYLAWLKPQELQEPVAARGLPALTRASPL
jgi:hypothetical protein